MYRKVDLLFNQNGEKEFVIEAIMKDLYQTKIANNLNDDAPSFDRPFIDEYINRMISGKMPTNAYVKFHDEHTPFVENGSVTATFDKPNEYSEEQIDYMLDYLYAEVEDVVSNILYYNRKGCEELSLQGITYLIKNNKIDVDNLCHQFRETLDEKIKKNFK